MLKIDRGMEVKVKQDSDEETFKIKVVIIRYRGKRYVENYDY